MKQVNSRICAKILVLMLGLFLSTSAFAQITVKGLVKDDLGEPLPGAHVVEKGNANNGAVTDFNGNFTLQAKKGATLVVSYIGFSTKEVTASSNVVVALSDDSKMLDDVVVIGYGTAKKSDMTGSVTVMKPDEENHGLNISAQDMIQGKIAGVTVISDGGTPGGSSTIRIRGGSSLSASNDPLIVIDGMAMDNDGVKGLPNPLSMVNPADIESFTVLKDASATAIYGSRASNGVIIITTKKGKAGSPVRVSYSGNVSISKVKSTLDVMDGNEYRNFIEKIWGVESEAYQTLGKANTDWQDEIYRTSVSSDHNITLSGGLKHMPYRVSAGFSGQNGIIKTSKYQRTTLGVNLNPSLFDDHLVINLNGKGVLGESRYADTGVIGAAFSYDPTQPVRSDEDIYQQYFGGYKQWYVSGNALNDRSWSVYKNSNAAYNPVATLNQQYKEGHSRSFVGNAEFDYKIHGFEDLHLHANGGADYSTGTETEWWPTNSAQNNYYGNNGKNTEDKYNLSLNAYAQYIKDFNANHHLDVMAGYEWQHFHRQGTQFSEGTYPETTSAVDEDGNSLAGKPYGTYTKEYETESYLTSFFGRLNYNLLGRYMLTATVRYDGSSRFSKDNRWGLFPSVALGWRINEEAFLKDVQWLSDLKLRLGYGITGQQDLQQGDYPYIASYTQNIGYAYYPIVGDGTTYRPSAYNKDLRWEKTTTYNVGLDYGFWNNRVYGSIDWYYRNTDDLINTVYVAAGTNFKNKVVSNIGSLKNTGLEFSVNAKVIDKKDWSWDLGYNVTWNKQEITKLIASDDPSYYVETGSNIGGGQDMKVQAHAVGHAASSFYVYQQVYDVDGKPIENEFVDRNGDGTINDQDRYFYKKPAADVTMGFSSKLRYKAWDLGFNLRASLNNYVYNAVEAGNSNIKPTAVYSFGALSNHLKSVLDLNFQGTGNYMVSDYFVQNASFLKCDNITLGYSFSNLTRHKLSGRLYATVQNVFTITKYSGLDPEIFSGIDNNIYPRPLTTVIGVNLNF